MKSILVAILLFLSFLGYSQFVTPKPNFHEYPTHIQPISYPSNFSINNLKSKGVIIPRIDTIFQNLSNGALLVRLDTNSLTIKAIQDRNNERAKKLPTLKENSRKYKKTQKIIRQSEELINDIKTERDKRNFEIITAFDSLTFCDVYYFYANDSKSVLNKQFNDILRDKELKPLKELPDLKNNYLIAEFGQTTEDTAIIWMPKTHSYSFPSHPNSSLERDNEGNIVYERDQLSSTGMEGGIDALVLLSPEFIQLQNPYPHYARTFEGLTNTGDWKYFFFGPSMAFFDEELSQQKKTNAVKNINNEIRSYAYRQENIDSTLIAKHIISKKEYDELKLIVDSISKKVKNSIFIGHAGVPKIARLSVGYERLLFNRHGIEISSPLINLEYGKQVGLSLNYKYYLKKNMNSGFFGPFLTYSEIEHFGEFNEKDLVVGLRAGRKWILYNNFSFSIGGGIGYPLNKNTWVNEITNNKIKTTYRPSYDLGDIEIVDIKFSIGYCF